MCARRFKAGAEWVTSPSTAEQAGDVRHALAKLVYAAAQFRAIPPRNAAQFFRVSLRSSLRRSCSLALLYRYAAIFSWLVTTINDEIDGGGSTSTAHSIGFVDIFGFEIFEVNSLEQLCINFANEKLQGIFNAVMLLAAKEEFAREGLPATALDFSGIDNAACRELVEGKPRGLFALLEEECVVPKGSDKGLADKLFDAAGRKHPCIRRPPKVKLGFALKHYAGEVVYDMAGFLPKNKDPFPEDLLVLLRNSSREFVSVLLAPTAAEQALMSRKRGARFVGVVSKFGTQLAELAGQLTASHVSFVRCLKPNATLTPRQVNTQKMTAQLRCNAVMETCQIMAAGYPDRLPFAEFAAGFVTALYDARKPLKPHQKTGGDPVLGTGEKARCEAILKELGVGGELWACGHTKVFLKAHVLSGLERRVEQARRRGATHVQARARRMAARRELIERREAAAAAAAAKAKAEAEAAAKAKAAAEEAARAAEAEAARKAEEERLASMSTLGRLFTKAMAAGPGTPRTSGTPRAGAPADAPPPSARRQLTQKLSFGRRKSHGSGLVAKAPAAAPAAEAAPGGFRQGDEPFHVERTGKVRRVVVQHVTPGTARQGTVHVMVSYKLGNNAPFVSEPSRLFSHPPTPEELAKLKADDAAAAEGAKHEKHRRTEEEKAASAAQRREEAIRELKEQMARDWTLWHPSCRPKGAHSLVDAHGDTPQELLEYAHYLGMVFPEDDTFLWIAEEGLGAELPGAWGMRKDPEGLVYFYDEETGQSARQHPSDENFRNMYYAHKHGGSEKGAYITKLISRVESRHIADHLRNMTGEEMATMATRFASYDPDETGVITYDSFAAGMRKLGAKTGKEYSDTRIRSMFDAADVTGGGEVDFNEFIIMQHKTAEKAKERQATRAPKSREKEKKKTRSRDAAGPSEEAPQQLSMIEQLQHRGSASSMQGSPDPAMMAARMGGGAFGGAAPGLAPMSDTQAAAQQLQMVGAQMSQLMQMMMTMGQMPGFFGSPQQQQMQFQFTQLQMQQQAVQQQVQMQQQQMLEQQRQQRVLSKAAGRFTGGFGSNRGGRNTRSTKERDHDASHDEAYLKMVALQTQGVKEKTRKKSNTRGAQEGSPPPTPGGHSRALNHAHDLTHAQPDLVTPGDSTDLGAMMAVGSALGGMAKGALFGKKDGDDRDLPKKSRKKSFFGGRRKSADAGAPAASGAGGGAASVAQPQSRGGGAPSEEEVRAVVKRCVASLETQGTRKVALQPFLQAMLDLNAQLGRATDLQQLQALFDAAKSEKDGMIDLRKFLSNPRAVSYFVNAPAQG